MHLLVFSFHWCVCRNGREVSLPCQFYISHSNSEEKKNTCKVGKYVYRGREINTDNARPENTWNYFYSVFVKMDYNSLKQQNIVTFFPFLGKICEVCMNQRRKLQWTLCSNIQVYFRNFTRQMWNVQDGLLQGVLCEHPLCRYDTNRAVTEIGARVKQNAWGWLVYCLYRQLNS